MTPEEIDRLVEILFYLYFNNIPEDQLGTAVFWDTIRQICRLHNVSDLAVIKACRLIMLKENVPTDEEAWAVLNKLGVSVRPLRKMTGIYWQKQKQLELKNKTVPIVIKRKIYDVTLRKAMRDFITAIYKTIGVFGNLDKSLLEKIM